ncbi:hypothetical protein [Novosphingobium colocasiae]|uniref:hypothetical protein n=1 Tax=Novosphingobium colocasiae TaxID=1256513 RepID=UPI0035B37F06
MTNLSTRIEQAAPEETRAMLLRALDFITGGKAGSDWPSRRVSSFMNFLNATAFVDAALMFLPENWVIASLEWWPVINRASITLREVRESDFGIGYDETCGDARSSASTPALAIAAAAVRVKEQSDG